MERTFKEKIQSGFIASPTHRKFNIEDWDKNWIKTQAKSKEDENIYIAGKIINELLSETRNKLNELYKKHAPKVKNERLLELLFALSNRDVAIVSRSITPKPEATNLFSTTLANNQIKNEITVDEIAHGAVDGLEKAILSCINRINKREVLAAGTEPIDTISFLQHESNLSQIYGMYESYWHALLWGNYEIIEINKEQKFYDISQKSHPLEIANEVSQIRKSRLSAQAGIICSNKNFIALHKNAKYIKPQGSGKSKTYKVQTISQASEILQAHNSRLKTTFILLSGEFPPSLLEEKYAGGFSILEALEVFRIIILLSMQYENSFPNDDSFYSPGKLQQFCVKIKKQNFTLAVANATGMRFDHCTKIIDFLICRDSSCDLWCHPLAELKANELCLLTSAAGHPVITRVVEHWLVKLKADLQDKGTQYEKSTLESLNANVASNIFIKSYDSAISKRITLKDIKEEEEIDLILRIENLIIIGEAKSIVTTDSPISHYRTIEILRYAAEQADRKAKFFDRNIERAFKEINWTYNSNENYEIIPIVINSNRIHAGFPINGIPVLDEKILSRYFESGQFPIMSTGALDEDIKHIAWLHLYSNLDELKASLKQYLKTPPQTLEDADSFERKSIAIPCLTRDSYKIRFSRLTPKNISPQQRISKSYPFPLKTVHNIEELINNIALII